MITKPHSIVILIAGLLLPVISVAAPTFSISAGMTRATTDTVSTVTQDSTLGSDYSDNGYRLAIGVEFGRWLVFEGGVSNFGENTGVGTVALACPLDPCPPDFPPDTFDLKQDGRAHWITYSPRYQTGAWEWSASIGGSRNRLRTYIPGVGSASAIERSGTEMMIGVGLGYRFDNGLGLKLDVERFGGDATHSALSLRFRF